jgi:hypothetical protein
MEGALYTEADANQRGDTNVGGNTAQNTGQNIDQNFNSSTPRCIRRSNNAAAPLFLFRGGGGGSCLGVFFLEALDAAGGIDQLLLAGEERMAARADFHLDQIATMG